MFCSLLDNGLRYAPADTSVVVTASLEGQRLVLRVTDRGPGLSDAERIRVFEPFYRAGRSESDGLGLAICRGLVRAQGGSIWIDSAPGRGTTVSVALPTASSESLALNGTGRCRRAS